MMENNSNSRRSYPDRYRSSIGRRHLLRLLGIRLRNRSLSCRAKERTTAALAVLGINGRGKSHIRSDGARKSQCGGCCSCDPDMKPHNANDFEKNTVKGNDWTGFPWRTLEDKTIDAYTATPITGMPLAVWACQAGKMCTWKTSHTILVKGKMIKRHKYNRLSARKVAFVCCYQRGS